MLLLVGSVASTALVACGGGEEFKNEPRPPITVQLTGVITEDEVSVQPNRLGAGPVVLTISNQSEQSHTVTLEGERTTQRVGPINPFDTGKIQETLAPGTYTVKAGSDEAALRPIRPATLTIGRKRKSSSDTVLLP
jgi:hypothetical protein